MGVIEMLAIRSYEPRDQDATIEIFQMAIRELCFKDYTSDQIAAWAQVDDPAMWARKRASRPTWIATYDGSPVGFSDLKPMGHLDMMFVHPRYAGLGVASILLRTVETAAHAQKLRLITTEASLTARAFFQSRGFCIVASQHVKKRGQVLRNFRMEKHLQHAR